MGLIQLIKGLSNLDKGRLLGKETTRIIRYSFVNSDHEALPSDILDTAVALHAGIDLVNKSKNREMLIETLSESKLQALGFDSSSISIYDTAIKTYSRDLKRFIADFDIEDQFKEIVVEDDRESYEYVIPEYGKCNGTNAFPHDYQLRLKKDLMSHLMARSNYNTNKSLVTMPTGAGKTVLAMETIVDLFRSHHSLEPLNICWLVNSKELAEQSLASFQKIWKQKGDRKVMAQRYFDRFKTFSNLEVDKITFATFQLLTPRLTDGQIEDRKFVSELDYLFIDEAHFTGADEYRKVFQFYQDSNDNPKIVGLTATPIRSEDDEYASLRSMFNHFLRLKDESGKEVDSPIRYLQDKSYLSSIEFYVLNEATGLEKNKAIDMSGYYKQLHESVCNTCQNIINNNQNTIIFAESKAHAIALSLYLRSKDIENELIVGETPIANRKQYLSKLADKKDSLNIIVNERILSTGIDVPGLNSIMVLSDIESVISSLQILGRAMRGPKNGGNKSNTVYLTRDNKNTLEKFNLLEDKALNQ